MKRGLNINSTTKGNNLLHQLAKNKYGNASEFLPFAFEMGLNPFKQNNDGMTPIEVAKLYHQDHLVPLFQEYMDSGTLSLHYKCGKTDVSNIKKKSASKTVKTI